MTAEERDQVIPLLDLSYDQLKEITDDKVPPVASPRQQGDTTFKMTPNIGTNTQLAGAA